MVISTHGSCSQILRTPTLFALRKRWLKFVAYHGFVIYVALPKIF